MVTSKRKEVIKTIPAIIPMIGIMYKNISAVVSIIKSIISSLAIIKVMSELPNLQD